MNDFVVCCATYVSCSLLCRAGHLFVKNVAPFLILALTSQLIVCTSRILCVLTIKTIKKSCSDNLEIDMIVFFHSDFGIYPMTSLVSCYVFYPSNIWGRMLVHTHLNNPLRMSAWVVGPGYNIAESRRGHMTVGMVQDIAVEIEKDLKI